MTLQTHLAIISDTIQSNNCWRLQKKQDMKKTIIFFTLTIMLVWDLSSQTNNILDKYLTIIKYEIEEWNKVPANYDTCHVYLKIISNVDSSFDVSIQQFENNGYSYDTSELFIKYNGITILCNSPRPIVYTNPLKINNNTSIRWKYFHFGANYYYCWDNQSNPRGIIKEMTTDWKSYSSRSGAFYYYDTNNQIQSIVNLRIVSSNHIDSTQSIIIGDYTIEAMKHGDNIDISFKQGQSLLKWIIDAENIEIIRNGTNSFSLLISTFWPNHIKMLFLIDNENKLHFSSEETICLYSELRDKWEYHTIISTVDNLLPWVVKDVEGNTSIITPYSKLR